MHGTVVWLVVFFNPMVNPHWSCESELNVFHIMVKVLLSSIKINAILHS